MSQFDAEHGEEWALHRSIARAIGGKVRAFDVYQGPSGDEVSARSERPVASCPITVRCYDNGGKTADRYTVVFHGNQVRKRFGGFVYLGMSAEPFHPQGFGQHGESGDNFIDYPRYSHLGKRIPFASLPLDCQKLVIKDLESTQ